MKSRPGRPKLPRNVRQLIARMVEENPTWGQGRVADELALKLGISGLTANGWGVLAEPTAQQRPLIAALAQLRSQSHSIVASLRFSSRGNGRLSPVVRLRADGNWHAEDCALQCHGPSDCRLDIAAVS